MSDADRLREIDDVVGLLAHSGQPLSCGEIARATSAKYWGPGRLSGALRGADSSGRLRYLAADRYVANEDESESIESEYACGIECSWE